MSHGRWYAWLRHYWEALRGSYWFFPGQMAFLSGVAALAVVELDRSLASDWGASVPRLTKVSAEGARAVLSTIAGSMITVTGVVFSITVVALTLTSSQFGPRLLRTFFRDRGSQLAMGTFLATFCYSLLVLRAVEAPERVPYVATAGAVLLALVSLFVLIFFVHHAANAIQASTVIAAVAEEIREQIPTLFPETIGEGARRKAIASDRHRIDLLESEGRNVSAGHEGYIRLLDEAAILEPARDRDLLVRADARPGDFVTHSSTIARVYPPEALDEALTKSLQDAYMLGNHRTPVQDLRFLTDQLAEMAVRALSPGVNDPKTAIECLHRLGGVLAQLATRAIPSGLRYDEHGALRLLVEPTRFEAIVASCFDAIRRYGASDAQVVIALLEAICAGARPCCDRERLAILEEHAQEAYTAFVSSQQGDAKRDRSQVEAAYEAATSTLAAVRHSIDSERT